MTSLKNSLREGVRFAFHQYPLYAGVMRVLNSRLFKWLTAEPEVVVARLRSGEKIVVDCSDYCGRPIYFWGDYDPRISRLCVSALKPGDIMLDIGANYGEIALAAAGKIGPHGAVHAFEPNPTVASYLRRSIELNHFNNLFVHQVALGARDGTGELFAPAENSGAASLVEDELSRAKSGGSSLGAVIVCKSDDYLRNHVPRPISVVKIDVEGMEGVILQSIEEIIREDRPRLICFESHNSSQPFFERDSVRCLSRLGYRFEQVVVDASFSMNPSLAAVPPSGPCLNGYDFVARRD